MKFEKGNPGKPKGAKNKIGSELREFMAGTLSNNKEKFESTLKNLKGVPFVKFYLEALQYTLPKLKAIELTDKTTLEEFLLMSVEERTQKINELKEQLKNEPKK